MPCVELDLRLRRPVAPGDAVRAVRRRAAARLGYLALRTARAGRRRSCSSDAGVQSAQSVLTCSATSKPSARVRRRLRRRSAACSGRRTTSRATHSQSATEQPAGLCALVLCRSGRAVPPLPWSSPVMTTTAFSPRGKYQKRGSGLRSRFIWPIRLASRRCCSSACGIATLLRSTQSGCGSPAALPKNRSSERIGLRSPSRSWPAQAGLPWRV